MRRLAFLLVVTFAIVAAAHAEGDPRARVLEGGLRRGVAVSELPAVLARDEVFSRVRASGEVVALPE